MDDDRRIVGLRLERAQASKQFTAGAFRNPTGIGSQLQGTV
jgi:hypothetical protein